MYIRTYRPEDLLQIELQQAQWGEAAAITEELANGLSQIGPAYTGRDDGDRILGCFGLWMRHHGVSEAWGFLAQGCSGAELLAITRAIGSFLDRRTDHRISTFTVSNWRPGQRWLRMLGFEFEGVMRRYTPNGCDCDLYSRAGGRSWAHSPLQ
jgi:hypothetical protein